MEVKVNSYRDKDDWREFLEITIDGELKFEFYDGEPEDNKLMRGFADCYNIVDAMKLAYEAGQNGEPLKVVEVSQDPFGEEREDE